MLSRLQIFNAAIKSANVPFRAISTTSSLMAFGEYHVPKKLDLEKTPADYKENPERDLVNFPREEIKAFPPKVRLGFIPDSWFNFFYNKTGVTGPYVLGAGFATYLVSKEFYIISGETKHLVAVVFMIWWLNEAFRKPAGEAFENIVEESEKPARLWRSTYENKLKLQATELTDHLKSTEMSGPMYFQAYRENYYLAMEAEYRRRLNEYKNSIKRKLDYFVSLEEAKRQYQRRHMVEWVVQEVSKNITDQVQKAALSQCVNNLKLLSQKH